MNTGTKWLDLLSKKMRALRSVPLLGLSQFSVSYHHEAVDPRTSNVHGFVENKKSEATVQHAFHRNDSIPSLETILRWISNLRTTGLIKIKQSPLSST